jgi:transposase
MAMGKRSRERQQTLWISHEQVPSGLGHPFYQAVNEVLRQAGFDDFVESQCAACYHERLGRPSIAPGVYFRCLLVGYFEGIDSERGIAWRCGDSLSLREFLGVDAGPPDHSSLSRTRRLLPLEAHERVFQWVLAALGSQGLVKATTVGIDATTLEANAAMRSIVRRDSGQSYEQFLTGLAQASGIATPTREQLARLDRKRKNKGSNDDWQNPHDPDAKITKMKDGRTHLAHKAEHAVDFDSGAVLAVTLQDANAGDTTTWRQTVEQTCQNVHAARQCEAAAQRIDAQPVRDLVADKGYHSNEVMTDLDEMGIRGYVSEPDRGRRNWAGKHAARDAVYANRRRIRGSRGKRLLRRRGELVERAFAHAFDTGGMRRTHLRGHQNILKRLLVHVGGFNLGLLMRKLVGIGKPRGLQGRRLAQLAGLKALLGAAGAIGGAAGALRRHFGGHHHPRRPAERLLTWRRGQVSGRDCRRLPHAA